jgi:hypothetical protein
VVEFAQQYYMKWRAVLSMYSTLQDMGFKPETIKSNPKMFSHFKQTVALCKELGATAKDYLDAQFSMARQYRKNTFPLPTMLHSEYAKLKYFKYMAEKAGDPTVRGATDSEQRQQCQMYLKRYQSAYPGMKTETLLRAFEKDFPSWFVKEQLASYAH